MQSITVVRGDICCLYLRTSCRTVSLYVTSDLTRHLSTVSTNVSPATLVPHYDPDTHLLFLSGKVRHCLYFECDMTSHHLWPPGGQLYYCIWICGGQGALPVWCSSICMWITSSGMVLCYAPELVKIPTPLLWILLSAYLMNAYSDEHVYLYIPVHTYNCTGNVHICTLSVHENCADMVHL